MKRGSIALAVMLATALSGWAADLIPPERTAIFPEAKAKQLVESVCYDPPEKIDGYWTPTEADLKGMEDGLAAFLKTKAPKEKFDWATYRRQVAGVKRGEEKFIFVYYSCFDPDFEKRVSQELGIRIEDPTSDWKERPVKVLDGGWGYFRVLYDVQRKRFVWAESNGEA